MAVKKAIVLKEELPPVNSDTVAYVLRYRIISEDKNRTSQWSPTFVTNTVPISAVSGAVQVSTSVISAVWGDELNRPKYDVFVGFDGATATYHGTTPIHSYQFIKTGTTNVRVIIQVESSEKTLNANLQIYNSGLVSLV